VVVISRILSPRLRKITEALEVPGELSSLLARAIREGRREVRGDRVEEGDVSTAEEELPGLPPSTTRIFS